MQIRGSYFEWSPVISGVPQGSILGLIMFLIYVNDIPNIVTSTAKLFADDTKIYRQINKVEDSIALQSEIYGRIANPIKCEVIRITHNKNKSTTRYQFSGTELRNVSNSQGSWSYHGESPDLDKTC